MLSNESGLKLQLSSTVYLKKKSLILKYFPSNRFMIGRVQFYVRFNFHAKFVEMKSWKKCMCNKYGNLQHNILASLLSKNN